jgi:hypothetical protein
MFQKTSLGSRFSPIHGMTLAPSNSSRRIGLLTAEACHGEAIMADRDSM